MNETEFNEKFNTICKNTMSQFTDRDKLRKRLEDMSNKDGKVSNEDLAISLSLMSMEYTNKLTHQLLESFLVDEK